MNEVLYIFNNTKADAIIFEDMDRYNANQIFVKLREINTLINNKSEKAIRFFYLLRDDIFSSKDRTKFFDFILPIVPVIDGSNSYDQFLKHFEDAGLIDLFDKYFLQNLSLYIDDMRILKNVYNEFIVYYEKIHAIELDNNKLLSIIVYKNLFPRDFSELQLSRGYVHHLFSRKSYFIQNEIQTLNKQIKEIDKKLETISQENLENIDELDTLYIKLPFNLQVQIDGSSRSDLQSNLSIVKAMKESQNNIQIYSNNSNWRQFDIKGAINQLDNNQEYLDRKKIINDRSSNILNELKQKKQTLQAITSNIVNKRLKDIINKDNADIIFQNDDFNEIIKGNHDEQNDITSKESSFIEIISSNYYPLIKYLIRNGYIDETYSDYMTYFYENSISKEDKIYLRTIADETPKNYDFSLKNPEQILSRLKISDFNKEEILNFDLLAHLLKNTNDNRQYIEKIIDQLKKTKNVLFVSKFLDTQKDTAVFISNLVSKWTNFIELFLNSPITSQKQQEQFVIDLFNTLSETDIVKMNEKNILTNYISEFSGFFEREVSNIEIFIKKLKVLSVKFKKINTEKFNPDLFDAIYKNDMYQINFDNISFILENIYKEKKYDEFKHRNYTLITSKSDEPLSKYVRNNINDYLHIVIENSDNCIFDDESCMIEILNNDLIDIDYKNKYIEISQTIISDISNIKSGELYDVLLKTNLIKNTDYNILTYYFTNDNGLNETLIGFINRHEGAFDVESQDIDAKYGEGSKNDFISSIIKCDNLSNTIYENILKSAQLEYTDFDIEGIPSDKFIILINLKILLMTESNLVFVRENYSKETSQFILKNIDAYIEILTAETILIEEILDLLEQTISDELKIELLGKTNEAISIKRKKYSEKVTIHILKNNFDVSEIPYLIELYDNETEAMKSIIIEILVSNVNYILTNEIILPYIILIIVLKSVYFDHDNKMELFTMHLAKLDLKQIEECFKAMNLSDYLSLFENKRPKIIVDQINEKILTVLRNKNLITKFEIDKKDMRYYRAYGKMLINDIGDKLEGQE